MKNVARHRLFMVPILLLFIFVSVIGHHWLHPAAAVEQIATKTTQELPEPKVGASQENPVVDQPEKDPLIAQGEENVVYLGVLLLAIGIATGVGLLTRRLDYAIIFSFLLSVVIIAILMIL